MKIKSLHYLFVLLILFLPGIAVSQNIIQTGTAGFIDSAPRQIVCTSSGFRFLIFAASSSAGSTGSLRIYKGNAAGVPSSFSRVGSAGTPIQQAWCISSVVGINDTIHIVWFDNSNVYYTKFAANTNTWSSVQTIGDGQPLQLTGGYPQIGIVGVTMDIDSAGDPHVVYNQFTGNKERLRYRNRSGGVWSVAQTVDDGNTRHHVHPVISFGPGNDLHLIWINAAVITESFGNSGSLLYRKRSNGAWGSIQAISDSSIVTDINRPSMSIDQSPGLLVTKDSVIHICFLTQRYFSAGNKGNYIRYFNSNNSGSSFSNQMLNNPDTLFTHDPCLAADGAGNVFIFGHDGDPESNFGPNIKYIKRNKLSGQWGQRILFAVPPSGDYDCSVSSRWQYYFGGSYGDVDVAFFNFSPFQIIYGNLNAVKINLKLGIEGFWNGALQVPDTVRVYLRNPSPPFSIADSGKAFFDNSGEGSIIFSTAAPENFYLMISHRNSLTTWSNASVIFPVVSSTNYDFTLSADKAFGDNMTLKLGRYCIYSGDVNRNGVIELNDIITTFNDASLFISGYVLSDLNYDNIVNLNDLLIAYNNSANFEHVIQPLK